MRQFYFCPLHFARFDTISMFFFSTRYVCVCKSERGSSSFGLTICLLRLPAALSCVGQFNWNGNRENVAKVSANTPPQRHTLPPRIQRIKKRRSTKSALHTMIHCQFVQLLSRVNFVAHKLNPSVLQRSTSQCDGLISVGILFCLGSSWMNKRVWCYFLYLILSAVSKIWSGKSLNHGNCSTNCWICFTIVDIIKWFCE